MAAQIHDRISIEPDKMDGQPCIRGLRFPVVSVLRMIAGDMTADEILDEHPDLEPEDIPAALRYAAEALAEHYYPLRPVDCTNLFTSTTAILLQSPDPGHVIG
jgi:uncharacterized protein (DUF433 family)